MLSAAEIHEDTQQILTRENAQRKLNAGKGLVQVRKSCLEFVLTDIFVRLVTLISGLAIWFTFRKSQSCTASVIRKTGHSFKRKNRRYNTAEE